MSIDLPHPTVVFVHLPGIMGITQRVVVFHVRVDMCVPQRLGGLGLALKSPAPPNHPI